MRPYGELWSSLTLGRIIVLGHRGYPTRYPENTLASLLAAIFYGADGVELDVWATSDGKPVLLHDRTTGRVAEEDLDITRTPYPRLRRILLGKGQSVISLEEVLELYPREKVLMVEVKDPRAVEGIHKLLERYRDSENTYIVSFDPETLVKFRRLNSGWTLGMNFDKITKAVIGGAFKEKYGLEFIGFPITSLAEKGMDESRKIAEAVHARGLKLMFWSPLELSYNPDYLFLRYLDLIDIAVVNDPRDTLSRIKAVINAGRKVKEDS